MRTLRNGPKTLSVKWALLCWVCMSSLCSAIEWGVNLAGAEFGSDLLPGTYGTDYIYPSDADLQYYAGRGIKLVRLPVRWERLQPQLNGDLDNIEVGRLDGFLSSADARGVAVIVDVHNYGYYPEMGVLKAIGRDLPGFPLTNLWKRLIPKIMHHGCLWGYDLMNEPHDLGPGGPAEVSSNEGKQRWFDAAQDAIREIRKLDPARRIIVSGYQWSHANDWLTFSDNLKNLDDPAKNLIFQAHQYFDWDKSGLYTSKPTQPGGHPGAKLSDTNFASQTGGDIQLGRTRLTPFVNWLNDNGTQGDKNNTQGIVGEYGVPAVTGQEAWLDLMKDSLSYLQDNKNVIVASIYWAGGPWWNGADQKISIQPYDDDGHPLGSWTDTKQMEALRQVTNGQPSNPPLDHAPRYDFEQDAQNWWAPPATPPNPAANPVSSADRAHTGSKSIQVAFHKSSEAGFSDPTIGVDTLPSDLGGKMLTMWVWVPGGQGVVAILPYVMLDDTWTWKDSYVSQFKVDDWNKVMVFVPAGHVVKRAGVQVKVSAPSSGVFYVDSAGW